MDIPNQEWCPSMAEYHSATQWWGSGMLGTFRFDPYSAFLRWGDTERVIDRPQRPTIAMHLGATVDQLLTDPEIPVRVHDVNKRTEAKFWSAQDADPDHLHVTRSMFERAADMIDSLQQPRTAMAQWAASLLLSQETEHQYSYRWDDPTGVKLKIRPDGLTILGGETPTHVSLKCLTGGKPHEFKRTMRQRGLDVQAAFYERGIARLFNVDSSLVMTYFVVIDMDRPHSVYTYRIGSDDLERGRIINVATLENLGRCLAGERGWATEAEMHPSIGIDEL
jgi:hypothetical protein